MAHLHVIGIGAGDPRQLTFEGAEALAAADVVFAVDKGDRTDGLMAVRRAILTHHRPDERYRWAPIAEVPRDRSPSDYGAEVRSWHQRRADRYEEAFATLGPHDTGAMLVWGDPSLYDSTLRIVEDVLQRGTVTFTYSVVPGVTSVSALAAAHRIPLHRIGEPVLVTTGRRLVSQGGWPPEIANVAVMLDGDVAFTRWANDPTVSVWWGAYLGLPEQMLMAGRLVDVCEQLVAERAAARAAHGWIMDVYLLRRG